MDIGMLWFDKDPSVPFSGKVKRASQYYQRKYGKRPDICYVHPRTVRNGSDLDQSELEVGGMLVQVNDGVLPHHFWIGIRNGKE